MHDSQSVVLHSPLNSILFPSTEPYLLLRSRPHPSLLLRIPGFLLLWTVSYPILTLLPQSVVEARVENRTPHWGQEESSTMWLFRLPRYDGRSIPIVLPTHCFYITSWLRTCVYRCRRNKRIIIRFRPLLGLQEVPTYLFVWHLLGKVPCDESLLFLT